MALATAGCSGLMDDDDTAGGPAGTVTTAPGPGSGSGAGPDSSGPTATIATAPPGSGPTGGKPATTVPPAGVPAGTLDASGPVGSFGPAVLGPARSLRLEVFVEEGAAPAERTVPALRDMLAGVAGKEVALRGAGAVPASGPWTAERIRSVAGQLGAPFAPGEAGFRLLFLKGELADNGSALGVAVNASTAALFTEKIAGASGLLGDRARFEVAVGTHEVGHLLGLVDLVLEAGREDPGHPGHSASKGSVMYWAVESDLIGTLLSGGPPTEFDADDRSELEAIRRRGAG